MSRKWFIACCTVILLAPPVLAQSGPRVIKLTLSPAAVPIPALKYQLFPELRDLKSANAAVFYQRAQALDWWPQSFRQEVGKVYDELEQPWQKSFADKYSLLASGPVKEMDYAARCDTCDWQMLDRVRAESAWLVIPDVQAMRSLGFINAGRARIEIHRGEFDKAVYSMQSGFSLGKHVGEAPILINALVGYAISNITLNQVQEFVQEPKAPNLYWALTDLPHPLIDLRRPLQGDRLMMDSLFPGIRQALKDPKAPPLSSAELRKAIDRLALNDIRIEDGLLVLLIAKSYPTAKEYFLRQGRTAEAIDALSVTQVVLMHQIELYHVWADELCKLHNLPYWEAYPRFKILDKTFSRQTGNFLGRTLMPAYDRILTTRARLERRIAMLRCVEALRLYAAEHGRLPDSLDAIRAVPVPGDPMTGRAFFYRIENKHAILEGRPMPFEEAHSNNAVRMEIQLAQ